MTRHPVVNIVLAITMAVLHSVAWPATAGTLDADTELYVLGVYEGDQHKYGKVTVFLGAQQRPVALLLTAYESIDWQIELEPGAQLARVFLSGYHMQRVSGIPSYIPVESSSYDQNSSVRLYGYDDRSCVKMVDRAAQLYGQSPREFLCQYRGVAFALDRNGIRALPVQ